MSEQELAELVVVKHSRHDRVAGQQAGAHHVASSEHHDANLVRHVLSIWSPALSSHGFLL